MTRAEEHGWYGDVIPWTKEQLEQYLPYGHIRHPEIGETLAYVKDGKITGVNGRHYMVEGDEIKDATGTVVGYLSLYRGPRPGNGDLTNELFRRR